MKSKCGSDYSGAYRYNIELYDTTGEATINMSHELVFLGHARGTQDCIQVSNDLISIQYSTIDAKKSLHCWNSRITDSRVDSSSPSKDGLL